MKKHLKKVALSLALITVVGFGVKSFAGTYAAFSDFTSFWAIKGIGSLTNTAIAYIDVARDFVLYDGDVRLGGKGSAPSTTAGEYPGYKVQIKNCGTAAWVQGHLIVVNDDAVGCGATVNGTDRTDVIGVSEGAVAVGSVGYITVAGYALVLTTGTVNRGDVIVSSAPGTGLIGYAGADTTPTTGADVGVALSSGTAAGGLTLIRLR
jgi:hypothetical protein